MKYIITITTTDANGNTITTTERAIATTDARAAHTIAANDTLDSAIIRVYPDTSTAAGLMRGAVMVGRRTAINAVKRQGTPTQHRIECEFAAINARLVGAETPERIAAVMADYSADTQDFYSVALVGLAEARAAGQTIAEQYHSAFLALNRYTHSQRAATDYEISTEFITDGGGDIVAINAAFAAIIRGGDKWTPTDGGTMDAGTAARLGAAIADAMRIVTPTQRRIAELLARGYSQRQIAEKTERELATVNRNIAIMRGKIATYMRDNAPEFVQLIRTAETAAAAENGTTHGHGTHAEHAAYMREYRARKAAERTAGKGE